MLTAARSRAFAFCKFLFFHNNLCRINFLSITVGITSGLNTAFDCNLQSFSEVFLRELGRSSKHYTINKICSCISIFSDLPIYCQCVSGNCNEFSPGVYLTSGSLVRRPIKITLFISYRSPSILRSPLFCNLFPCNSHTGTLSVPLCTL